MLKWATIFMISLIILTSLRDIVATIGFLINQEEIAQNQCRNKFKPELMCHGSCVLKDIIKENHQENDTKIPSPRLEEKVSYVIPSDQLFLLPISRKILSNRNFSFTNRLHLSTHLSGIFRPPRSIA